MLKLDWYIEHPLDFEYKNYILLDYLQSVDKSYQLHQLSPYLLWTEKLVHELKDFEIKKQLFLKKTEKTKLSFEDGTIRFVKRSIDDTDSIRIIGEIIEYSCPILESKIKLGYKLLSKYPQLLF